MDWFWKIFNFAIFVLIIALFIAKPVKTYFRQRKELIESSIKESREANETAKKALAEAEGRLKLKDKDVQEIILSAMNSGRREKERLIQEGEKLKIKILKQAKTNIDYEVKKAKEMINAEAVESAIKLAEEKIKGKITEEDQNRLLQESLELLERKN